MLGGFNKLVQEYIDHFLLDRVISGDVARLKVLVKRSSMPSDIINQLAIKRRFSCCMTSNGLSNAYAQNPSPSPSVR